MRDQLAELVRLMVDQPELVEVDEVQGDDRVVLNLRVAEEDLGKIIGRQGRTVRALPPNDLPQIIGRQGRTVRALRSLVAARAAQDGHRYVLQIAED